MGTGRGITGSTSRRWLLGAAAPALFGAAACAQSGAGGAGGGAGARPGALKTDVTVGFLQTSGQAEQDLVNQVVARWKQAHPNGPQAEFILSPGDVVEKYTGMAAAGAPPALVSMSGTQSVGRSDRGDFAPLDDLVKRDRYDLTDYIPTSLDQYRWKGKLYGLLRDFSHQSLWINLDFFEQAGLPPPTGDYGSAAGGWDFGRFVDAAVRLTRRESGVNRATPYGFAFNTTPVGGWSQFVFANGAEVFDKDFKRCLLADERAVEGLQLFQDLIYRHRAAPDTAALAELRGAGVNTGSQQLFFENQAAMAFFPVARIGEARRQAKGRWDLVVAPQGKGKRTTTGGGVGWFLSRGYANQEEAWALLQHLTSAETHTLLADVRIPGRRSVLDAWLALSPAEAPKSRAVARTGQEALHISPIFPLADQIDQEAFAPQVTRLVENKATAGEIAREMAAQANRILGA